MQTFYLSPNDIENTLLVSSDGVVRYKVKTLKPSLLHSCARTIIESPEGANGVRSVAVIKWRRWSHPSVKTSIFDGTDQEMELREFLYKLDGKFTSTRYFLGSDDIEYRWKDIDQVGPVLSSRRSKLEVARFTQEIQPEGPNHTELKWYLQILDTTLSIDMIVLTFVILEKRRRDRLRNPDDTLHDEEPVEGGCGEC